MHLLLLLAFIHLIKLEERTVLDSVWLECISAATFHLCMALALLQSPVCYSWAKFPSVNMSHERNEGKILD